MLSSFSLRACYCLHFSSSRSYPPKSYAKILVCGLQGTILINQRQINCFSFFPFMKLFNKENGNLEKALKGNTMNSN